MMRIGFDCTPLLVERSGVHNYTERLLAELARLGSGWRFHLLSNRPLGPAAAAALQAPVNPPYFPASRWIWMQLLLPAIIRRLELDLCHFPNNSAPLFLSVPSIVTIHDASLFLYSRTHPRSRLLALRLLLPLVARRADAVITVSHFASRELQRVLRLPAEKIHVIYEAAPADFRPLADPAAAERLRRRYHLPERFILYVGTIEPRKNLRRLVRAIALLHRSGCRVPLFLAGPMGWKMDGVLEREIEALGLQEAVQLLGFVPQADLPGLYALAEVFAFPSLHEGFGLPPLEAMACGTAVLTSRDSAMAEICGPAAATVDPLDEAAIAAGLHDLLVDPARREALAAAGLARAAAFSWERAARETAAVYARYGRSRA